MLVASCQAQDFYKREYSKLQGYTEAQLLHKYGEPANTQTNTVAQFAQSPEPWQPLIKKTLAIYPTNITNNLSVEIKAISWRRDRIMITAWLHITNGNWTAFYADEWNMDVIE
jgi:hypothetical protein